MTTRSFNKDYIFLPRKIKEDETSSLQLLRIEAREKYTKIDFGYQTKDYYPNGGWINISRETYILTNDKKKLKITDAENIPFAPDQHEFDTTKDYRFFSLYFPPLPKGTDKIDLIEADDSSSDWFNFMNIDVSFGKSYLPGKSI